MMVYYQRIGEGEPLILLHSGGMSHREWLPQVPHLEERYSLILIDLPGHGDTPMKGERLSIRECGEAVLSVMDREGLDRAHLCGSSMGGATALWIAMHHNERVDRLIFYRANYYKSQASYEGTLKMADPEHWVGLGIAQILSDLHLGQGDKDSWKEVIQRVSQALDPKDSDHGYTLEELATIEQPVLIVCGDRDPLVPMDDLLDMYYAFPDAALWIMPDATHITGTNIWRSEIFAREIERFLRRRRAQRR